MPILPSEIITRLSTKAATAGNQLPQTPNLSLGKFISTTPWVGGVLHDLFDEISGDENANLNEEFRCIFIYNSSGLTFYNVVVWIAAETPGGATISLGVDPTPASVVNSASPQALEVANEDTAPSGVTFSSPTTKATGINLGDIPANYCKAIWIKRKAMNTGALNNDSVTLTFEGESPP